MARESAQIGANYEKVILGVSNDSALEPRMLRVDPITNRLLVDALLDLGADVIDLTTRDALAVGIVDGNGDQITSFGGGIQYTEGDTDATITGTALMWEDAGNTLTPISASKPLPVSATLDATGLATSAKQDTIISYLDGVETLLGTIDADTGSIDTRLLTITGHVDGIESLLTTIDADTGAIKTALETAGGLVVNLGANNDVTVTGTVDLGATDNAVLDDIASDTEAIKSSLAGTLITKGVPSDIDVNGANPNHADKFYTNAGAVTDGIIWSPAAGKRWHVLTLYINVSAAATVTIEDDVAAGDVVRWKGEFSGTSGLTLKYDKEHPFCSGEDGADLLITTTAGNVYVQAVGYEV